MSSAMLWLVGLALGVWVAILALGTLWLVKVLGVVNFVAGVSALAVLLGALAVRNELRDHRAARRKLQ